MSERVLQYQINQYGIQLNGVVHLGALDAAEAELYQTNKAGWVAWAEANPRQWAGLEEKLARYPGQRLFKGAITDQDDSEVEFHLYNHQEASSIYRPGKSLGLWYPEHRATESCRVPTLTVDTMLERLGCPVEECTLLVMDIQGAEHLALRGAQKLLSSPSLRFVAVEVVWSEFYSGGAQLPEVGGLLGKHGFRLARMEKDSHKAYFPQVQALIDMGGFPEVAQADALFVR